MDDGAVTDPVMELALRHAREQRDEMVLWLALQVLMSDDVALADDALQERLIVLQDRVSAAPPVVAGDQKAIEPGPWRSGTPVRSSGVRAPWATTPTVTRP